MTKYEWESELKKSIHRLPADEIKRVVEYYDELFYDKVERGFSEKEIIAEFGNPVDVADKILSEFDDNAAAATGVPIPDMKKDAGNMKAEAAKAEKAAPSSAANETSKSVDKPTDGGKTERQLLGGRLAVFVVFAIIFGGIFAGVAVALWSVVFAVGVSGVACTAAGAACVIPSVIQMANGFGAGLAQAGICLIACGVGILLIVLTVQLVKAGIFLTKKCFHWCKLMITEKKVA